MKWVDSYLSEIEQHLTTANRADILGELRASLEEHIDELAADRPPTEAHQKAAITALGHPMKVASGFNGPRYLIGPQLYPTFAQVLKIVLVCVAVAQCSVMLWGYVVADWTTSVKGVVTTTLDTLLTTAGIVTLVFIGLEALEERFDRYAGWTADRLSTGTRNAVSASDMVTNLISEGVFLLWWNGALALQNWIPGLGDVHPIALGPHWDTLYWPLNIIVGAWFLMHAYVFARGLWSRATLVGEIGLGALWIGASVWLLTQPPLLAFQTDMPDSAMVFMTRVATTIILVIAGFTAWDVYLAVQRLTRGTTGHGGGQAAAL